MPMIIDEIVVGLALAVGKKVIDRVWTVVAVAPQGGAHGAEMPQIQLLAHTMKRRPVIPTRLVEFENFADEVTMSIRRGGIGLLLAVEERSRGAVLFEVDLDGFELELPEGLYSFFVFLVEGTPDLEDARLLAIGLPTINLPPANQMDWNDAESMLDSASDEPIVIDRDCVVQMLLMHAADHGDAPAYFVDLFGNVGADLTGRWRLMDDYGHGTSIAVAELVQQDEVLTGMVTMDSITDDQERWLVQQWVNGSVAADGSFEMHGWRLRIIDGPHNGYYFDSWFGEPVGPGIYEGDTLDEAGSQGSFEMTSMD